MGGNPFLVFSFYFYFLPLCGNLDRCFILVSSHPVAIEGEAMEPPLGVVKGF